MNTTPTRPMMPTDYDRRRAEHQALRARMLTGQWADDLERALGRHVSTDRRTSWGIPELSRNPYRSITSQLGGVLYRDTPRVAAPPGGDGLTQAVASAGYWGLMARVSTDLVGLRELPIRVDYSDRGGLLLRPMQPHDVLATALPEAPAEPVRVEEQQLRIDPETGKETWVWEVLDVTDLDAPQHLILDAERKVDLTGKYLSQSVYQYIDSDGVPYLPVAWYHAENTGRLWDPWYGMEAVMGSLTMGVLLTFWVHGVKDGSFATVLLIGGQIVGLEVTNPGKNKRYRVISTEPGSLIEVAPQEDFDGQPSAVQLKPGFDPKVTMEAFSLFEAGLAEYAGVSPADLLRTGSDPRSGISLTISREGLRTAQSRFAPQLRRGDEAILSIAAKVLNRAVGTKYPEAGYRVSYVSLPLSVQEQAAIREDVLEQLDRGLLSKVDAYMRLNGLLDRDLAVRELQRIQRENTMFPLSIVR